MIGNHFKIIVALR